MLCLHVQHRLANQLLIRRTKRGGGTEHQVGGVFHLHQAPVVVLPEYLGDRRTQRGIASNARCNCSGARLSASAWARGQSSIRTKALSAMVWPMPWAASLRASQLWPSS